MPYISVIVPVYNVEQFLAKCLDSILAQSYDDYEVIVVNDGSTDGSLEIVAAYEKKSDKIRVISQENKGLGGARNTGIQNACGKYICFIDSDDCIAPDTLAKLAQKTVAHAVDIVLFDFEFVDMSGNTLSVQKMFDTQTDIFFEPSSFQELLLVSPSACNKLFKTALFTDNHIFFPEKVWYEDIRTIPKLYLHAESAAYIPQPFYQYLQRPGSIMNTTRLERNAEIMDALCDVISYYQEHGAYSNYKNELDFLAILNGFVLSSFRVLKYDCKHHLLSDFYDFLQVKVPDHSENPYIQTKLGKKNELIYKLLVKKQYRILNLLSRAQTLLRGMK